MNHNTNALLRLIKPHMDPTTLARFAATSRRSHSMTSPERKGVALIKRLVRRRKAIKKHFEHRRPATATQRGFRGRLTNEMFQAKTALYTRELMSPAAKTQTKLRAIRWQAGKAYWNYREAGTNDAWNRFVRIHIKSGGRPNINRLTARRMYN